MLKPRPMMLVILDGFGYTPRTEGNALDMARTETIDLILGRKGVPATLVRTSGEAVGLPDGQMGNSEVGHMNIGAGRVVYQDFTLIEHEIRTGEFARNRALLASIDHAVANGSALHLLGLVSDGGVHSHRRHVVEIARAAAGRGLRKLFLHAFTDGRDTNPRSGVEHLRFVEAGFREAGAGRIASVMGRYHAMDRDKRWDRIEIAYRALTEGAGDTCAAGALLERIAARYAADETDEFLKPLVVTEAGAPLATIRANDAVLFFNFRSDRARQMTRALNEEAFADFPRKVWPHPLHYTTMTRYNETFPYPVLYPPRTLSGIMGETVSKTGLRQLRIAETEKYAHVTFFFNGGEENVFAGEERILVPSPKVATYDLKPEMSAYEVTDKLVPAIESRSFDLIVCNFANLDMVGHTGKIDAAVAAVQAVDRCLGRIIPCFRSQQDGIVVVTADHGNVEQMIDYETGAVFTEHTTNPVPLAIFGPDDLRLELDDNGALCDVAPTALELMGIPKPPEMAGRSLLKSRPAVRSL